MPVALLATTLVVGLPPVTVALLGLGPVAGIPLCVAMSLALSQGGALLWRRLPQSRDVLFADLMLWGWIRRVRTERRLADPDNARRDRQARLPADRRPCSNPGTRTRAATRCG